MNQRHDGATTERTLGTDRGAFEVPNDFDEPLPDDVLADFGAEDPADSE